MKTVENIKLDHISAERLLQISMVLKTIANPVRLKIVLILIQQGESTVGDLKEQLDIEQSLLSHHLSNLRMNGVIFAWSTSAPPRVWLVSCIAYRTNNGVF